jgi:sugar lactone lactonase YvrE
VNSENRPAVIPPNVWITATVLVAVAVGVVAMRELLKGRSGRQESGLPDRAEYDIEPFKKIDPARIRYEQTQEIPTGMEEARAIAVGPEDRIYVAGDRAIRVFDSAGSPGANIVLDGPPACLAVGGAEHAFPGRVYVGLRRRVQLLDPAGKPAGTWEVPGERVRLTSIAVAGDDVFVADCGGRVVVRYDVSGKRIGRIGQRDVKRGIPGLVIPSPFFDVAVAPDGLLWVVNPGARRLEAYTFDGKLERFWGKRESATLDGFFGCCNPAHLAILPDGRFVTAEKGLLRVKVYEADGQLDGVVAGPEQLESPSGAAGPSRFDHELKAVDVAADSRGRVLILDLAGRSVLVYEPKQPLPEQSDE